LLMLLGSGDGAIVAPHLEPFPLAAAPIGATRDRGALLFALVQLVVGSVKAHQGANRLSLGYLGNHHRALLNPGQIGSVFGHHLLPVASRRVEVKRQLYVLIDPVPYPDGMATKGCRYGRDRNVGVGPVSLPFGSERG